MMKLSGYETYCIYLALKNHFTRDNYDFFKYNGKVSASKESFLNRQDRFKFEKLSRKCDDVKTHIALCLMADRTWIGDMLDDDAFESTRKHKRKVQSMSYDFKNEIEKYDDIRLLFKKEDGRPDAYPMILNEYMRGDISLETIIILNSFTDFIPKFDDKLKDDFLWSKFSFKARKFAPFLLSEIDRKKFKQILKDHMKVTI
jgi:hypothetical protein